MGPRLARLRSRIVQLAAIAFLLGLVLLALAGSTTYVAVHETAQPEFCNSCHIMEPYYQSWLASSHHDVSCIECHYEPGAVETFEGKFKALSQVAKYVTRTQGTKPWAEVSDASCMRSGCHSARELEGEVDFGRISFDHRHHLLEARRGRRLRCVSCHSQIVQGEHVSVTESVCFMCHFMPSTSGELPAVTSDCHKCHDSPTEDVVVDGQPFSHSEYVARGVDCRECHSPVIEGDGTVRPERCNSCHGEVGHIERIGETVFLHEKHVTDHKVECFECHDEIRHGLLPLKSHDPIAGQGCGTCHEGPHGAASLLYAGTGALGLEDAPSRMYETRVVCEACHRGRGAAVQGALAASGGRSPGAGAHGASAPGAGRSFVVAEAGNLDCVHCHGPGFDGMLSRWQRAVGGQLERIEPLLSELEEQLPSGDDAPAVQLYREARQNVDLVERDGSRGAHNPTYALGALRAGAERIDRAFEALGVERGAPAAAGFPFLSKDGCSTCHLGVEDARVEVGGRPFPHDRHLLAAGLECSACHSTEHHGEPAFPRSDCASCHHQESSGRDPSDCQACHDVQAELLRGSLPELADQKAIMGELECSECHGDPPDVVRPAPALCVLCHEEGFDRMQLRWQATVGEEIGRLLPRLEELEHGAGAGAGDAHGRLATARDEIEVVVRDGSRGAHNPHGALGLLRGAAERLDEAAALLGAPAPEPAASGFPFRSAQDCTTCHLGIDRVDPGPGGFPHGPHLGTTSLDCSDCHSVDAHGEPAPDRLDCTSCHHRETPEQDPFDCAACHAAQVAFVAGLPAAVADPPAPMAAKECIDCHGEPPDVVRPPPSLCTLCHEEGYAELPARWRARTDDLADRLRAAVEGAGPGVDPARLSRARSALATVEADGSHGVHDPEVAASLLQAALDALRGD